MANKPTSGPVNDPDIKGMIEESLGSPERGELIDIVNSSKAVKTTFEWLSNHMDNPQIKRVLESNIILFDFIANCRDTGTAEAFADDYISQKKIGLTMSFENFLKYKFGVYVKAFGGEKAFKALVKKVRSDKIEISPKAPVRDDEATKKVDYRKNGMPESGRILTIDSYNPDGDYNSEEEVPLFPNLIGVESEKYRNMSLDALKKEIEIRKEFRDEQVKKSKLNKGQQVSEIFLIGFEWLQRYYNARLRVVEKPRKQKEDEAKAKAEAEAKAREDRKAEAKRRLLEQESGKTRHDIDEAIKKQGEREKLEREKRARAEAEAKAKAEEAERVAQLALAEEMRKFNEAQKRRQEEEEKLREDEKATAPEDENVRFSNIPPPRFKTLDPTALSIMDLNDIDCVISTIQEDITKIRAGLDPTEEEPQNLKDLISDLRELKSYREERIDEKAKEDAEAKAKAEAKEKEAVSPKAEALIRAITVEQWQDLLHMADAMGEKKEWIDETFKFSGDGKIVRSGDLDLRNNPNLTRLPENLEVGGNLFIPCCIGLASIPKSLKVDGHIYVSNDMNEDAKKEAEERNKAFASAKASASAKATADENAKEASESNEKLAGYRFEIREGGKVIGEITLNQKDFDGVIKIGRNKGCHLSIDNSNVSRMHAIIEAENPNEIFIMDLGSIKGTCVNGKKINRSKLHSGDVIKLGEDDIEILFSVVQEVVAGTDADDDSIDLDDADILEEKAVEAPTAYPKNPTEKIMRLYSDFASQTGTHIELNKLTETFRLIVSQDSKVTVGIVTPGATIEVMDGGQAEVLYSIGDFTDKPLTVLAHKRKEGQVQPIIFGEFADTNPVIKPVD